MKPDAAPSNSPRRRRAVWSRTTLLRSLLVLIVAATALVAVNSLTNRRQDADAPASPPTGSQRKAPVAATQPFPDIALSLGSVTLNGRRATALIGVENRAQEPYVLGETVVSGIVVAGIYPDHVVLRRGDTLRVLRMSGAGVANEPGAGTVASLSRPPSEREEYNGNNPLLHPELLKGDGSGGADDLLRDVRVAPYRGGRFLVQEVAHGSVYEKLGVRPGDVVYSLDTLTIIKLEELSKSTALYHPRDVRLEVLRDDRPVVLTYRFD